jgi:regulator of sigma E protease
MTIDVLIIIALCIIGLYIIIGVHELGHYFMTKLLGYKVRAVDIGFGKKFFKKTIGETKFSLGYFFIGGRTTSHDEVGNAPLLKQQLITLAGPLSSIAFGMFVLSFIFHSQAWLLLNPSYYLHAKLPYEIALSMAPFVKVVLIHNIVVVGQSSMLGLSLIYLGISSILVGFFNLFPIPPLDGGKIVFQFLTNGMSDIRKEFIYSKMVGVGLAIIILLNVLYSFNP